MSARLGGGLGNQLFLYSAAAYKAKSQNYELTLDISQLTKKSVSHGSSITSFDLPGNFSTRQSGTFSQFFRKLGRKFPTLQKTLRVHICKDVFDCAELKRDDLLRYVEGIFFENFYWDFLHNNLGFDLSLKTPSSWTIEKLLQLNEYDPILVHIRRGDYLDSAQTYGLLSVDYYRLAIDKIIQENGRRKIWVFSDDITLIKEEWKHFGNVEIEYIEEPAGTDPAEILYLLSRANFLVVGNSTFSWWAAKVNLERKQTIYPFPFYRSEPDLKSIYPPSAILMESIWK